MNAPSPKIVPSGSNDAVYEGVGVSRYASIDPGPATPISPKKLKELRQNYFGRLDEEEKIQHYALRLTQAVKETYAEFQRKSGIKESKIQPFLWQITPEYIVAIEAGINKPEASVLYALNHMHGFFNMGIGKRWHEAGAFEDQDTARDTLRAWQQHFNLSSMQLVEKTGYGREHFCRITPTRRDKKDHPSRRITSSTLSSLVNFYELMRRHPDEKNYVPGKGIMQIWNKWNPDYDHDPKAFSMVLKATMSLIKEFEDRINTETEEKKRITTAGFCRELYVNREGFERHENLGKLDGEYLSVTRKTVYVYARAFELWMTRHHITSHLKSY